MESPPFISLLMPTRWRRALAERFLESVAANTAVPDRGEVIYYADEDDPQSHELRVAGIAVSGIIGPRASMGTYNSECLARARGDIVILVNDDIVIRTQGWDEKVRAIDASFADKIYLAYGNDLFKGPRLCTFPILSRRTCDLLGDPFPAAYAGAFIDYHLLDIFRRLQHAGEDRVRYLPDIIFEHMHYRLGKAVKDATYQRRRRFDDDAVFIGLIETRRRAARALSGVIQHNSPPTTSVLARDTKGATSESWSLVGIARAFLLDRDLPLKWRVFLWYWYTGRLMAAKGFLWPFVK